jgi:hypothetical protein
MDRQFTVKGYVVDELIGFGGTGEVWRAHDIDTGETVALKRLRKKGAAATERLRRESQLLATVAGPHVISARRLIVEDGEAVLVMDYAAGGSLASVLGVRGKLPAPEVVTVLAPIAAALAAAHARDLVHGDLTPANILFTAAGRPVVADFGIAQALGTVPEVIAGTASYLDPAVVAGAPMTGASDLYSLGAIGFAALSGQLLWGEGTPDQIEARASLGIRAMLDELEPDAPPALVAAIESALRLEPDERPDARAFANAVLRASAAAPVGLVVVPVPTASAMTSVVRMPVGFADVDLDGFQVVKGPPVSSRRRIRRYAIQCVVVAVALLASVGLGMALGHNGPVMVPRLPAMPLAQLSAATASATPRVVTPLGEPAPTPTPTSPVASASTSHPPWTTVVTQLDALRSKAFADGDPAPLASVYVPGTAAYAADLSTVSSLVSRGLRASGFTATVEQVTPQSGTATTERLRVVDRLAGYTLVDRAGAIVGRGAPRPARAFTMQLTRRASGWLVQAIAPG